MDRLDVLRKIEDATVWHLGDEPYVALSDVKSITGELLAECSRLQDERDEGQEAYDRLEARSVAYDTYNRALQLIAMLCDPDFDTDLAIGMYGDVLDAARDHEAARYAIAR